MTNENREISELQTGKESGARIQKVPLSLSHFITLFVGSAVLILGLSWFFLDETLKNKINDWTLTENVGVFVYSLSSILILSSDLVLPIPSSAVITHAGSKLGVLGGTMIGWTGITLGSVLGFMLARWLGTGFVKSRVSAADRNRLEQWTKRFGIYIVVVLRPVPIFAEASVLVLAAGNMPIRTFMIWLAISNFFVALFFASFGKWAESTGMGELPAVLISISIPVLLLFVTQYVFKFTKQEHDVAQ